VWVGFLDHNPGIGVVVYTGAKGLNLNKCSESSSSELMRVSNDVRTAVPSYEISNQFIKEMEKIRKFFRKSIILHPIFQMLKLLGIT
jgi:histidine ammonia-lyase